MKRLKYSCPFGGKKYPFFLATVLPLVVGYALAFHGNVQLMMSAILLLPIVILVVCFLIEQHMTPYEKEIVDATEPPLWQPITQDMQERIRAQERPLEDSPIRVILCSCGIFVAFFFVYFGCNGISIALAAIVTLSVLVCFFVYNRSDIWSQVDDTAVYIEVPIHHMYDVRHTARRRRLFLHYYIDDCDVWYVSYLVFYLHNGRYTLRVPPGGGTAHSVVILKFQDHIRWLLQ